MGNYIVKRLLISLPILLVITALIFTLLQFTPGDPLDAYIPPDQPVSAAQRELLRKNLGLDQPPVIRYFFWLKDTATGNLGYRAKDSQPVSEAIVSRIGPTLILMVTALVIGITIGIVLGVVVAVRQYSFLDFALTILAFLGISTPAFLLGLLGLYLFALQLHWFPAGGFSTPGEPFSVGDQLYHLILPAVLLSLSYIATMMRYTRSTMLEVLNEDYVRTARAKGLGSSRVISRHALRNALLPVVTVIGASIPNLLGGAVFIESIFSWPGMGQLYLDGIESRDYPLIMGITLILATTILVANLLTDIAYAAVDPRIRLGRG